jgi:hypothetical protein
MRALRAFTVAVLSLGLIAAACGGSEGESPAQAKAKITTSWEKFFDPSVPLSQKTDLLENYSKLRATAEEQLKNPIAKTLKARVNNITLQGKDKAAVRYDLNNAESGQTLLKDSGGQAVRVDGKWMVSQITFCGLVSAGGGKCPS